MAKREIAVATAGNALLVILCENAGQTCGVIHFTLVVHKRVEHQKADSALLYLLYAHITLHYTSDTSSP